LGRNHPPKNLKTLRVLRVPSLNPWRSWRFNKKCRLI
jgi:hypothetical protein